MEFLFGVIRTKARFRVENASAKTFAVQHGSRCGPRDGTHGSMEAKGKVDRKTGEVTRPGKVSHQMMQEWVSCARVELRGAGLGESPHCYKRLDEVLMEPGDSVRILHMPTPVGVAMAGANEFDPYKDEDNHWSHYAKANVES